MTNSRRERRAEVRRVQETRSQNVAACAASKRRVARAENNKDAEEINRMRARRKFDIPDDPTQLDDMAQAVRNLFSSMYSLMPIGHKAKLSKILVLEMVVFALVVGVWWAGQCRKQKQIAGIVRRASNNTTSLARAMWDLAPFEA